MKKRKLFRKILTYLFLFLVVVLFFASTIVRWYVQKNSETLLGRRLEIGELHLNYLKVSVDIQNFVLFEENKADTFISFNELYINIQPWRMVKNEYALKEFFLDSLFVQVEQQGDIFNFDDLIPPGDSTIADTAVVGSEENARFSFRNISIQNSNFNYLDKEIDNLITLHNLNLQLPLLAWNNEQSEVGVEFKIGEKGHLHIDADVNNENETYSIQTQVDSLDLKQFSIYLKPYMNTSGIQGFFNSDILVTGSMTDYMNVIVSGYAGISDFMLPDEKGAPVFATKMFSIGLDSIDILNQYYGLNTIKLSNPQLWVETGKETSNIEYLFAPLMLVDSTEVADSAIVVESDTMPVFYSIDSVLISRGEVNYTDASLNRPFKYNISPIDLSISDISEKAENVPVLLNMVLNNKGTFKGSAGINMQNFNNVTFSGDIDNLELMSFSPYSEYYVARPITQGDFNYHVEVEMTASELKNENVIRINELEFGDKTPDTTAIKIPIRLALYILKDKNDKIALDIPVWGNPSDPDFAVGKIVWKTFSNFIIKTALEPFSALASMVGTNPESIRQMNLALTQDTISTEQRSTLDKLGEILQNKPEFVFTLTQETPSLTEIQELAIKQIIIDYLLKTKQASSASDTLLIANKWNDFKRSNTEFIKYVNNRYGQSDSLSIGQKCLSIIGKEKTEIQFSELLIKRNDMIQKYLCEELQLNKASIVVQTADIVNMRTQFEVPVYRIEVSIQ
jgi:Domain of Unknown Function (DUF748)